MTTPGAKLSKNLQKTIHIDYTSYIDDVRYVGDFIVKKLNIRELAALGVRKAQLNGGMHFDVDHPGQGVDSETDELNGWVAHMEIAVVQSPPWFKMGDMTDLELLKTVYKEVVSFENSFLKRKLEAQQRAAAIARGEGGSDSASSCRGTATRRKAGVVVDAELQAALEP